MNVRICFALAAVLSLLLCGCSKTQPSHRPGTRNPWTIAGVLRVGNPDEPDSLNPMFAHTDATDQVAGLIYSSWLRYDDNGNYIPDLATQVPSYQNGGISKDGKTLTFHLRRNVRWSDGVPLTVQDWVFTYHAVMNPANNTKTRYGWDEIAWVRTPDPYTLIVRLNRVDASILGMFGVAGGAAYPPLPVHLLAKLPDINRAAFNGHPLSSGPYVLQQWNHGASLIFTPNPYYFRGRPKLRKIVWKIVPNVNTLFAQLQTHEVDVYLGVDENDIARLPQVHGITVIKKLIANWRHMGINTSRPQLHDARVRLALLEAVNWKRINDTVYHGYNTLAVSDVYPQLWAAPKIEPYRYDPAGAKRLLAQAGWSVGSDGVLHKGSLAMHITISTNTEKQENQQAEVQIQSQCGRTESTSQFAIIRRVCSSPKTDRSTPGNTIWNGASKRTDPIRTTGDCGTASSFPPTAPTRFGSTIPSSTAPPSWQIRRSTALSVRRITSRRRSAFISWFPRSIFTGRTNTPPSTAISKTIVPPHSYKTRGIRGSGKSNRLLVLRTGIEEQAELHFEPAREGVLSWNTLTDAGTLEFRLLRAHVPATPWLQYAQWSAEGRRSFSPQHGEVRVDVDVIKSSTPFDGIEARAARVEFQAIAFASPARTQRSLPFIGKARILDVPARSQYVVEGERGWCSPAELVDAQRVPWLGLRRAHDGPRGVRSRVQRHRKLGVQRCIQRKSGAARCRRVPAQFGARTAFDRCGHSGGALVRLDGARIAAGADRTFRRPSRRALRLHAERRLRDERPGGAERANGVSARRDRTYLATQQRDCVCGCARRTRFSLARQFLMQPQDSVTAGVRGDAPLHIALVEPQIPPNTGNVARLCAATGCRLHLVEPLGFRIDDRALKRAGLDYWKHVDVCVHRSLDAFLECTAQLQRWYLSTRGRLPYAQAPFEKGDVLVFGKETAGLPQPLIDAYPDRVLRIPQRPAAVRSLNLSTAAGIVAYAALARLNFPELV